jgi:uncharacterized membrane protein YtjA (UPF0391 family)
MRSVASVRPISGSVDDERARHADCFAVVDRPKPSAGATQKEQDMLSWAITFFVIAIIAAVLGFSGVAGTAANIAYILAVLGIILAIVFLVMGRRPPT